MLVGSESDPTSLWKLTPHWAANSPVIFSEVGYRYYYDDFRDGNFLYQLSLHGAQVTVGLTF
jgi:hypothetical protein